jgi:hypothetical protein
MKSNNKSDALETSEDKEHLAVTLFPVEKQRFFILDRRFLILIF